MYGDINLTPSQAEVLSVVGAYGPLSVREIGEYLVCESGSPSRLVTTLVKRDLLARAVSATDRRASFIALTQSGRSTLEEVQALEAQYEQDLTERFDTSGADALARTLRTAVTDPQLAGALNRRFGAPTPAP